MAALPARDIRFPSHAPVVPGNPWVVWLSDSASDQMAGWFLLGEVLLQRGDNAQEAPALTRPGRGARSRVPRYVSQAER